MNRDVLVVVSLVLAGCGMCALFFLKPDVSPQYMKLSGTIMEVDERERVTFVTFVPDDFLVVSFSDAPLREGSAELVGRLQQYKGRVEFVVESAELVDEQVSEEEGDGDDNEE